MNLKITKQTKFIRKAQNLNRKIRFEIDKITKKQDKYPESLIEFVTGVKEFTESVLSQASEKKFVTVRQLESLENMLHGLKQWTKKRRRDLKQSYIED